MSTSQKVLVVGAGIIGASIAYHLAQRGARVTLVDRGQPAGEATEKSFAWINASYGNAEPYFRLRLLAMQEYRRLEQELGGTLRVNWCGCLSWDLTDQELEDYARRHGAWGYDVRLVEQPEIRVLEPKLIDPPQRAAYAAGEATLDPVAATKALLEGAERHGATIRLGCEVTDFVTRGSRLCGAKTAEEDIEADSLVLAAGVDCGPLAGRLGVSLPMRSSPGLLLHCKPTPPLLKRVVESPGLHVKQELDGRLVVGEDFGGGPVSNDPAAEAERLLTRLKSRLRGSEDVELERVTVGLRPIPADGLPAVGFARNIGSLYIAVMHNGITLAPAVGRFAAMEILDGVQVALLDPFRPARFQSAA